MFSVSDRIWSYREERSLAQPKGMRRTSAMTIEPSFTGSFECIRTDLRCWPGASLELLSTLITADLDEAEISPAAFAAA